MSRVERHSAILELLGENGRLTVDDLVEVFGTSLATARRDLDELADQQLLTRTRGGAVAHSVAYDLPLRYKNQEHAAEKGAIARAASAMVPTGSTIALCGGTTTTAIAQALISRPDLMEPSPEPNLTVVTNAINIVVHLAMRPQIKTIITGGVLHSRSFEVVGTYTEMLLQKLRLDIAFIGVNGIDDRSGPTAKDEREASVNTLMAERASHAVIVADSSKIDRVAFATIGHPGLFRTLITDSGITADQRDRLEGSGLDVVVA
ncbi:DeoR/GlpR family DNA-binding transcription regulator [Microbacterium sp. 179-I 3D2 NHS]|uniref:DeoR/GlpR family DNA-binding transcription regulator n=1 Tax=Microbacterium sp. 179-I 3D2 NHS TaxID=3235178 RepID=UPI0039A0E886